MQRIAPAARRRGAAWPRRRRLHATASAPKPTLVPGARRENRSLGEIPACHRAWDEAPEVAGPVSHRETAACWHTWIRPQMGLRKERRVSSPQGRLRRQEQRCLGGTWPFPGATIPVSVLTQARRGKRGCRLAGRWDFLPAQARTSSVYERSALGPGGSVSETIKKEREESPNRPAHTHRHGRTQTLQLSSGDQFPQLFHTAAGLRGALKTGSQWCNFEGNSQSQAIKG